MAVIYVLTEGGGSLGMGHISRCLSLCQAFELRGFPSQLVIDAAAPLEVDFSGIKYQYLDWLTAEAAVVSLVRGADIVIIDSYRAPKSLYDQLASVSSLAVYIDDNMRINYPQGLIVNGVMCAENFTYPLLPQQTCLLGHRYAFLRREFWNVPEKEISRNIRTILISCGGNDVNGLSYRIVTALAAYDPQFRIKLVVQHAGNPYLSAYQGMAEVYWNLRAAEMRDLMIEADIAITASGQTTYELCRTGTPFIAITTAANQLFSIDCFHQKGLVGVPIDAEDTRLPEKVIEGISVLADQAYRQSLHHKMKQTITGDGSLAVVDHILSKQKMK